MNDAIKGIFDGWEKKADLLATHMTEALSKEETERYYNTLLETWEKTLNDLVRSKLDNNPKVKDGLIAIEEFMKTEYPWSLHCKTCRWQSQTFNWFFSQIRVEFVGRLFQEVEWKDEEERQKVISMLLNDITPDTPEYKNALISLRKLEIRSWAVHNFARG